jgi:hypothetical protein
VLKVIREECARRRRELPDDHEVASEQWTFDDLRFINELCLTLLVAVRHQVEREVVGLAARVGTNSTLLSRKECRERVRNQRDQARTRQGRDALNRLLQLDRCREWSSMEALRLLANSYKHNPYSQPDQELLEFLKLDRSRNYMPLPESAAFQEGLAEFLGLGRDADYCDIVEHFLAVSERFVADVQNQNTFCRVSGRVSLIDDVGY